MLDKNATGTYVYGRLLAVVEAAIKDTKFRFPVNKMITSPINVVDFLPKAVAQINHTKLDKEMAEIMGKIDGDFPAMLPPAKQGAAWVGYYHEKSHIETNNLKSPYEEVKVTVTSHSPEKVEFDGSANNEINELRK